MDITTFVLGGSVVSTILLGLLKGWIKNTISARFGDLGVIVVLFTISVVLATIGIVAEFIPAEALSLISKIFAGAMIIYQVLVKAVWKKAIRNQLDPDEK